MGRFDIFDVIEELRRSARPFCIATVVRTADATSAKAGAKAAVTSEGEIIGHLGGACVRRAVTQAAEAALRAGEPSLIRVKPSEKVVSLADSDGVPTFKSGCPSGGTVDLLIEPYSQAPMVAIFGDTPISRAIAAHALLLGYRVGVQEGTAVEGVGALRFSDGDLSRLKLTEEDFVVVASQGHDDVKALRAAMQSPVRHVSMIASRRKADVLMGRLLKEGLSEERADCLKSPAGLDLKCVDPQEIAVSVLAEIILWRNQHRTAQKPGEERQGLT